MAAARTLDLGRRKHAATLSRWPLLAASRAWTLLRSVRVALLSILLLAAAILAGTLIEQAPPSVLADPASFSRWLERVRPRYGGWSDLMERLQLFQVFSSTWFRILLGWIAASIVACTINRWPAIRMAIFHPPRLVNAAFFDRPRLRASVHADCSQVAAVAAVHSTLRSAGYRTIQEDAGSPAIYGDRYRFSRLGTFASHLSILLLLAGAALGALWGWRNEAFVLAEGSMATLPEAPGISVQLVQFSAEYHSDGRPRDFASEIVIYDRGTAVRQVTVRPNSPASYRGMTFSQSFFGQAAIVEVLGADGSQLYKDGVPLAWSSGDTRPAGVFEVPQASLTGYVIGPSTAGYDGAIPEGSILVEMYDSVDGRRVARANLSRNQALDVEGSTVRFLREARFSGLTVASDPGLTLIWLAGGLLVVGLVLTFWFPHRQIWALCDPAGDGGVDVRLAAAAVHHPGIEEELAEIAASLELTLARTASAPDEQGDGRG